MNYKTIGFKAGLEIHQQLDTHKLFCNCQSKITEDIDYSFERFLRPTQSEMGDVDKAALAEAKRKRRFLYTASDKSTCLVEVDEEPPHSANKEATDVGLTMALLLNAKPVDEIHFMRKIVIDGSTTSGFQRTALVATGGKILDVGIKTIALEEDAARKIKEKGRLVNYGLDRLGIPLIEIATEPDIKDPKHAREIAERIGSLLHATGKVKKGLGTIRQDLNVSISKGSRVEVKGIQSLSSISRVAEKEVLRQKELIIIQEKIAQRGAKIKDLENTNIVDLTHVYQSYNSKIISNLLKKEDGVVKGLKLQGFHSVLKLEHSRLGREFASRAKLASGVHGIIHSDELPNYGINEEVVNKTRKALKLLNENTDAFVICAGKRDVVETALKAVLERSKEALLGVPEEVRRALPDDTTAYMRPLPGAARMYPETDVPPVRIIRKKIESIKNNLPELPKEKHKRFMKKYGLNKEQAKQILLSGYEHDFERYVKRFPELKNVVLRTFLNTFSELEKEGVLVVDEGVNDKVLTSVFVALSEERFAKEAVPEILRYMVEKHNTDLEETLKNLKLGIINKKEIEQIIEKVVLERKQFVKNKGMNSVGPLMGIVMDKLRGKADGQLVSKILREKITKTIKEK
ncbi:glutamyl-tRNA(Gln) amidotransferase subunit E [Thermoplasmatales archaeon SCGC AB-539-C06]|nr:glutamyl-tRNA(Gln) amidotransferase subunit E [Thermoplasmatales archaeon SCGC AB-539-C06]